MNTAEGGGGCRPGGLMGLKMLDLFSGLGGASAAMYKRGWEVVKVDLDLTVKPDIAADIKNLTFRGYNPDLIWGSPPCVEFSRQGFPWIKGATEPSMDLVEAFHGIVSELNPRWWILENVQGAVKYFGNPQFVSGPVKLWGRFPPINCKVVYWKRKTDCQRKDLRAKMPYSLSKAVAISCEGAMF